MTTIHDRPDHLLDLAEWDALPEDNSRRVELVEGVLVVSPRPRSRHQFVTQAVAVALDEALRPAWRTLIEIERGPGAPTAWRSSPSTRRSGSRTT